MKIAGFYDESISNGEGWRAVLFVSGCPHNCPGCHNKEAQDFNYGQEFNKDEIIDKIKNNSISKAERQMLQDIISTLPRLQHIKTK